MTILETFYFKGESNFAEKMDGLIKAINHHGPIKVDPTKAIKDGNKVILECDIAQSSGVFECDGDRQITKAFDSKAHFKWAASQNSFETSMEGGALTSQVVLIPRLMRLLISMLVLNFSPNMVSSANGQTPKMTTFDASGHPKAGGLDFTLAYPVTWNAREGKRPHVVQMFVSPDPSEFLNLGVDDLKDSEKSTHDAALSIEGVKALLPENAQLITHTLTKLDGEVCAMCECISKIERAGIKIEERVILFILPHKTKIIILWGASAGLAGSSGLDEKFLAAKPRFQAIAATLFLSDKWSKAKP